MTQIELLAPAGNMEKLETVLRFGADAVYLGGKGLNLRAGSQNFAEDELEKAVAYTHSLGKKIFVTLNILARNHDLARIPELVREFERIKVDAVIVSDLGVLSLVREHSSLEVHVSTQASVLNYASVKMYQKLGAKRIILARELSLDEIREIRQLVPDVELEVFVHGAMCMSYSGRCSISAYLTGRDGNRGACTNPCRWQYALMEEKRPGEYFPVYEDQTGSFIYNSRELCTIEFLDQVIATGVNSLKIEGRGKGILYGAVTTRIYKEAMRSYLSGDYTYNPRWRAELEGYSHRGYTSGFYHGHLDAGSFGSDGKTHHPYQLAAKVLEVRADGRYLVHTRNQIRRDMPVEIVYVDRDPVTYPIKRIYNPDDGAEVSVVHPDYLAVIEMDASLSKDDLLRAQY